MDALPPILQTSNVERFESLLQFSEVGFVLVHLRRSRCCWLSVARVEKSVLHFGIQLQLIQRFIIQACEHLVEHVVVLFTFLLLHHSRCLQQESLHSSTYQGANSVKEHLIVLAEATGVAVPNRARVPEGLQYGTRIHDSVLNIASVRGIGAGDGCQVAHCDLGCLSLASSTFTGDDQCLVLLLTHKLPVRGVCDCKRMRWQCTHVLVAVSILHLHSVELWHVFVRVNCQEHGCSVGINLILLVSAMKIVEDVSIVKIHQRCVVIASPGLILLMIRSNFAFPHSHRL
mmetsp:Transcript_36009/g.84419  ORF Transcript_36009/g.84419 Transcript_36009/m.84419 type:complete len:287 (-) Transcript_36009:265-1125(-)